MTIINKIQELLLQKRYLRDCDKKLCTHIWYRELIAKGLDPHTTPITEFLKIYANGKLTSDSTITRLRCKLQETNPQVRGQRYLERQAKQNKVQRDLGYNV